MKKKKIMLQYYKEFSHPLPTYDKCPWCYWFPPTLILPLAPSLHGSFSLSQLPLHSHVAQHLHLASSLLFNQLFSFFFLIVMKHKFILFRSWSPFNFFTNPNMTLVRELWWLIMRPFLYFQCNKYDFFNKNLYSYIFFFTQLLLYS